MVFERENGVRFAVQLVDVGSHTIDPKYTLHTGRLNRHRQWKGHATRKQRPGLREFIPHSADTHCSFGAESRQQCLGCVGLCNIRLITSIREYNQTNCV